MVRRQPGKIVSKTLSQKHKTGLVEWFKCEALSSNLSTTTKTKQNKNNQGEGRNFGFSNLGIPM
jgi:hypothetical protein